MRPVPIALIHERVVRLDLLHDKVILGAEAVVVYSITGLQSLPF